MRKIILFLPVILMTLYFLWFSLFFWCKNCFLVLKTFFFFFSIYLHLLVFSFPFICIYLHFLCQKRKVFQTGDMAVKTLPSLSMSFCSQEIWFSLISQMSNMYQRIRLYKLKYRKHVRVRTRDIDSLPLLLLGSCFSPYVLLYNCL